MCAGCPCAGLVHDIRHTGARSGKHGFEGLEYGAGLGRHAGSHQPAGVIDRQDAADEKKVPGAHRLRRGISVPFAMAVKRDEFFFQNPALWLAPQTWPALIFFQIGQRGAGGCKIALLSLLAYW